MATTIYCFDPETGEYTGITRSAKLNSDGKEMIPPKLHASQTADVPPSAKPGYAVCRKNGEWVQVEDHRKTVCFSTATGAETPIKALGPMPDNVTTDAKPNEFCSWQSGAWVEDTNAKTAAETKAKAESDARDRIKAAETGKVSADDIAIALGMR